MTTFAPSLSLIRSTFANEVTRHGGAVLDTFEQNEVLIIRATLALADDVRPDDTVNGGVALKCYGSDLEVHPYVFRQVCSNGAIISRSISSMRLQRVEEFLSDGASDVLIDLAETIGVCAGGAPFEREVTLMRSAADTEGSMDMLLNLLPAISTLANQPRLLRQILNEYIRGSDDSVFGIMNAITATAREQQDPEVKWELEELGGGVPARLVRSPSPDHSWQPV